MKKKIWVKIFQSPKWVKPGKNFFCQNVPVDPKRVKNVKKKNLEKISKSKKLKI